MRQHLRIGRIVAAALGFAGAACSSQSWASTIVAPVDAFATSNFGPTLNDYSIENTIDQSGLSLAYTSGVTDFSSYFATNPTHTSVANHNEWFSQNYRIRRISGLAITYSFGALAAINGFALWNEEFAGIGTTQLLSSVDGITYTPLTPFGTITPTPSTFAQGNTIIPYLAQIFSFDLTTMSSFRLLISNCAGQPGFRGCGIGEVAFSAVLPGQVSPVPLPAALPLLGSAIGFFVWLGRRRKNCN